MQHHLDLGQILAGAREARLVRLAAAEIDPRKRVLLLSFCFSFDFQSVEGEFIRNGHYTCTQIGCGQTYKTLQALIVHEEMKHNALELYLGTIIENDLYEPLNRNNM